MDGTRNTAGAVLVGGLLLSAVAASSAAADDAGRSDLDDAIVVVATRRPTGAAEVTAAVTVLTADDIERRQATHVDDVLREVPGVLVVRDGPVGQFSRVFLRGAASNQTLFVVDGVPQNDATTGGGFDLNDLGSGAVERIEVLRGSYGVLYGSEAIGGVVAVTTRRGGGPTSGFERIEAGSFDTHREVAGVSGGDDTWSFALTGANHRTHGERRRESYAMSDVTARVGYSAVPHLQLDWSARLADSRVESPFDFGFGTVLPPDANIERRRETLSTGLAATWAATDWLDVRAHVSHLDVVGAFDNGPDGVSTIDPDFTPGSGDEVRVLRDEFSSRSDQDDLRGRLEATARIGRAVGWTPRERGGVALDLTCGTESLRQASRSRSVSPDFAAPTSTTTVQDDATRTRSLFAQARLGLPDVGPLARPAVTVGLRRDDHSEAGRESSPFLGARVDIAPTATTVRASYGEGFRAPKPAELFDPFVGNAALRAETSASRDIGVRQGFADDALVVEATWFELQVDDLIAYDAAFTPPDRPFGALRNFQSTRTRGTEWALAWRPEAHWTVRASYTRQRPEDVATGLDLPNRSRSFGALGVAWEDGPFQVSLDAYGARGSHDQGGEFVYPEGRAREHPGRIRSVDLAARWRSSDDVTWFVRIENLLDDDHVATPSSPAAPPLAAYAGVQWDF